MDPSRYQLVYKGAKTVPVLLDDIIHPLFSCANSGNALTSLIFSQKHFSCETAKKYGNFKKKDDGYFSFLTAAETRVLSLNVSDFSLLPGTTGKELLLKGFIAVRFTSGGRIQYLTDFDKLLSALLRCKK